MQKNLNMKDIIALGFMTFAFFLGAGNIIFPPLAGLYSGEQLLPATLGFLITAVGLPLTGIIAVAVSGGWLKLIDALPEKTALFISVAMFVIIGPAFAAPRAGLVAYEMGFKPFIAEPSALQLAIFSLVFFAIAAFFSAYPGKLIDSIGKLLTPVLFVGLAVLAVAAITTPQAPIGASQGDYVTKAFSTGFLEGYNTMDTFGALIFGMLIVDIIRKKGITCAKKTRNYLVIAGLIAAAGLIFVYVSLFYLGATSSSVAGNATNGGQILASYVTALFGSYGTLVLAVIIVLACLTTVIGLISACADYFCTLTKFTYNQWVFALSAVCALVANVGLTQLITISVPVLFALYPVAIMLIVLAFFKNRLADAQQAYRIVLSIAFSFALLDAAKVAGVDMSLFDKLPLFDFGMAWLIPSALSLAFIALTSKAKKAPALSK
ncbi:MAG: branched-chain amino acid transport system II carrier protein [Enterovibrio sp.]